MDNLRVPRSSEFVKNAVQKFPLSGTRAQFVGLLYEIRYNPFTNAANGCSLSLRDVLSFDPLAAREV